MIILAIAAPLSLSIYILYIYGCAYFKSRDFVLICQFLSLCQAECEELQQRVETLSNENRTLRDELQRLSEECEKLTSENNSIKVVITSSHNHLRLQCVYMFCSLNLIPLLPMKVVPSFHRHPF